MKRTAEKSLAIISVVLSTLGIIMSVGLVSFFNIIKTDPRYENNLDQIFSDPTLTAEDLKVFEMLFDFFGGTMWFVIIGLIISVILTIVGLVNIWNSKNPKLAGIMFIIAGVLAGFISLPSILLYIAGILCFTRKPLLTDKAPFTDDQYDGTMRPL